jgi:anthrone oxygenase-like protein
MTIAIGVAIVAVGLFAGASLYVSVVEHPAWMECGPALAVKHFGPSARRAGAMQGGLAMVSLLAAGAAWVHGAGTGWLVGGLLVATMIPFTFIVIMPVNRRLLDSGLSTGSAEAVELLRRWGRLHAMRTAVGVVVLVLFVILALRSLLNGA